MIGNKLAFVFIHCYKMLNMIKYKNFKTAELLTSFVNDNEIKRVDIVGIGGTNLQIATRNELILFYYT